MFLPFLRRLPTTRVRSERTLRTQVEALEPRLLLALVVPAYSSLPGADHTIYLDFDGHVTENTNWNSYYDNPTINSPAYNIDGDPLSFSATELARIEESWRRIVEDFAPFQVNVTTVDPGIEALRKFNSGPAADAQWGVRAVVTADTEGCGCGGIAYINSFNWSTDIPVFVHTTGGKSIAEAASHEIGHSLGLSHDGSASTSYYTGHGSGETGWAPIMGVGYYDNVTQWDRGEYFEANNGGATANYGKGPDDLAIITSYNGFGYRADDHGDDNSTASLIGLSGITLSDSGTIETTDDVDVFSFITGAGLVTLNIDPLATGPNLDIKADLYDGAGSLVATSDSSSMLDAAFSLNLAAGQYFLHVDGTGWGNPGSDPATGYSDYGSLGQYSITGSIVDPSGLPTVGIADASANENAGTLTFTLTLSEALAADTSVDWITGDGSATAGADYVSASGTATFAAGETMATVTVTLMDDLIYESSEAFVVNLSNPTDVLITDAQATGTIMDDDPEPLPTVSIGDAGINEGKLNTKGKKAGTPQLSNMTFTVTLSAASSNTVTVAYATTDGSATTADNDYQAAAGSVTFNPGETSKTIVVTIVGDNTLEGDETFTVNLSGAVNADLGDGSGIGTIVGDDSGGGGGGGNKGGGKGGGKKIPTQSGPTLVVDPIWYFEAVGDAPRHSELAGFFPLLSASTDSESFEVSFSQNFSADEAIYRSRVAAHVFADSQLAPTLGVIGQFDSTGHHTHETDVETTVVSTELESARDALFADVESWLIAI